MSRIAILIRSVSSRVLQRLRTLWSLKPVRTIVLVPALAALPLVVPGLRSVFTIKGQPYQAILPNPRQLISFRSTKSAPRTFIPQGGRTELSQNDLNPIKAGQPCADCFIDDPAHALDHFYAALARTESKQEAAITRISHYGDSPLTNDGISGVTRRLLQTRFGDAGHGFILPDRPWWWYNHQAISFATTGDWEGDSLAEPRISDGLFGLGGVKFQVAPGRVARFATSPDGDTGKDFSRMDVYYLQQPAGGEFGVTVNNEPEQVVSTNSDRTRSGFFEIRAPQRGANTFEIKTLSGSVRIFGAVLENEGPGVVYDSLGISGCYAEFLNTVMNQQHWTEQLQHRNPDLVILNFGTNESQDSDTDRQSNEADLIEVVRRIRSALPKVSILIIAPMDRGRHAPGGTIVTWESIPKIVEVQRKVAHTTGCAFFNMFAAMGGEGTIARWYSAKAPLVLADLTHPNPDGAAIIGVLTYQALMDGYSKYLSSTGLNKRQPGETDSAGKR